MASENFGQRNQRLREPSERAEDASFSVCFFEVLNHFTPNRFRDDLGLSQVVFSSCFLQILIRRQDASILQGMIMLHFLLCHRTVEDVILAGSTLTLNRAVGNMIDFTRSDPLDIVPMATLNPAKLIGLDHRKGCLRKGMDADIAVFDNEWNALMTIISGRIVYSEPAKNLSH